MKMGEKEEYEVDGGAITLKIRMKIDKGAYKDAIPVSEARKILQAYLRKECKDAIEVT
jgi:hypothetical protein